MPLNLSSSPGQATPGDASPGFVGLVLNPAVPAVRGASATMIPAVGATQTVSLPPGGQPGDLIVIYCAAVLYNTSFSSPGFNATTVAQGTGNGAQQVLWKQNTSDLAGTLYTITASQADAWGALVLSIGNEDQSASFDGGITSGAVVTGAQTAVVAPGITMARSGDMLVWLGMTLVPSGTPLIAPPAGYTVPIAQAFGTIPAITNVSMIAAYSYPSLTGATGLVTGSLSTAQINGAAVFAVPLATVASPPVRNNVRRLGASFIHRLRRRRTGTLVIQPTGVQFPLVVSRKFRGVPVQKFRTRTYNPIPAQGQLSQPFPTVIRQQRRATAGAILQLARLPRYRQMPMAPPPQGPLAPNWVPQLPPRRPVRKLTYLRRPKGAQPHFSQALQPGPVQSFVRRHPLPVHMFIRAPRHRGSIAPPVMPQGNQGQGNPAILPVRARRRPWAWYRRHKVFSVPTPKQTQQARAVWTASSTWHVTPLVTNVAAAAWKAPSTWKATGFRIRQGAAVWTAHSGWRAIASAQSFGAAHWTAVSSWTATGFKVRHATASWTSSSTWTTVATRSRGGIWTSGSVMSIGVLVTHPAAATWSAASIVTIAATSAQSEQEILIVPLAIPGVNEPGLKVPVSSAEPVTEAVIDATIQDELFDS